MSIKVWSIRIQKHTNNGSVLCLYQILRSVQSGKNDRNEMNSVDAHRVWLCIRVIFSSPIRKVSWITC